MPNMPSNSTQNPPAHTHNTPKSINGWKIFGIIIIGITITAVGIGLIKYYLFPSSFTPVELSLTETETLNVKLNALNLPTMTRSNSTNTTKTQPLKPEAYSEAHATREIMLTEREINAMIAHNTKLADKLVIDLSNNLASAKLLLPLDPDMPLFGGKTLNLSAGITLAFNQGQPIIALRGISAWGVPVPNAWMGNLKNIDFTREFGHTPGFWKSFADGIESLTVEEGTLKVTLKE